VIHYKTHEEIESMKKGGKILADVLWEVMDFIKPGITEIEIDSMADRLIEQKGAEAAFKKVKGYNNATCISTNNIVVHGIPSEYKLKEGDIIGVDCGVYYKGMNTDMSETFRVPKINNKQSTINKEDRIDKFLSVGKQALEEAIKDAVPGNRIGHISKTIQDIVEKENGYSIVRSLIGHGVGKNLHEDPEVPGYLNKKIEKTQLLRPRMTIAIEIIYNMGSPEVSFINKDRWTIGTSDGSLSGLFERTIAITENGPLILTK
jgi:methionyl aminopeptidase